MGKKTDKKITSFVKKLKKHFKIEKAILFGSRAVGENLVESDYDLLLVSPDFEGTFFTDRIRKVSKYWDDWSTPLEALCYTPDEFAKKSNQIGIVREAIKTGIELG